MREKTAKFLACEESGEIRDDYSGRALYGQKVFGVTFDDMGDALKAIAQVAYDAGVNGQISSPSWGEDEAEELLDDLKGLRWDSMGLRVIVY